MSNAGILLLGALAVSAVMAITMLIIAMAPYLAAVIIVFLLFWFLFGKTPDVDTSVVDQKPQNKPPVDPHPRE